MPTVVIAGGGLAGLVAARNLADEGFDVHLFERREEFGGRVATLERDGFVLDRGFQVLLTDYPAARRELDYDALDLRRFPPGVVLASQDGRSTLADPLRNLGALPSALFTRAVTTRDKLLALSLRRELARTPDDELLVDDGKTVREGLEDYGFSERFVERVAAPLYGGITLDRSLSTSVGVFRYTFDKFSTGHAAVPADGMGAIPAQLAERARDAGATLHRRTAVTDVTPEGSADGESTAREQPLWQRQTVVESGGDPSAIQATGDGGVTVELAGETVTADAAVVATDPPTAKELTGVESIPTESQGCVTQYYSLPAEPDLPVDGRLVVNAGGTEPNHVVAHSQVAPGHAPVGRSLVSATFLGTPEDPESALAEKTRKALSSWFPEMAFDDMEPIHTERVPFAQFAQPPGFRERLPDPRAPEGPVVLAGDYTRWSSIQGAIESGRQAAWAVESHLG
ncbi:phytoene dehydrogenase [Halobacteriales archaeon QS_1_68_20]|nr:MAG: phytoene dehydrogenase [Halobacteriales archaeon QS_1_68_20]